MDIHLTAFADCTARCTCLGLGSFVSHSSRPDQRFHSSKTFFKKENTGNLKRWLAGTWMITSQAASTCSQAAWGCPPGWTCPKHLHLEARHQNSGPAHLFISPHSQTRSWVGAVTPLTQSGTSTLFTFEDHALIFISAWGHQPTSRDPLNPSSPLSPSLLENQTRWERAFLAESNPHQGGAWLTAGPSSHSYTTGITWPFVKGPYSQYSQSAPWQELVHNQGKILN